MLLKSLFLVLIGIAAPSFAVPVPRVVKETCAELIRPAQSAWDFGRFISPKYKGSRQELFNRMGENTRLSTVKALTILGEPANNLAVQWLPPLMASLPRRGKLHQDILKAALSKLISMGTDPRLPLSVRVQAIRSVGRLGVSPSVVADDAEAGRVATALSFPFVIHALPNVTLGIELASIDALLSLTQARFEATNEAVGKLLRRVERDLSLHPSVRDRASAARTTLGEYP